MILTPEQGAQRVDEFLHKAVTEMDARVLFVSLLLAAAAVARKLNNAKVYNPQEIAEFFDGAKDSGLSFQPVPTRIRYVDSDDGSSGTLN